MKHIKTAVFIVSAPHHVLYSMDAIRYFGVQRSVLVFLVKKSEDIRQVEYLQALGDWDVVLQFDLALRVQSKLIALCEILIFMRIKSLVDDADLIFFADYGRAIAANARAPQVVWLGDGTKLLYQNSSEYQGQFNRYKRHALVERVLSIFTPYRLTLKVPPLIFSPMKMNEEKSTSILNDLPTLRELYLDAKVQRANRDYVYFLGSYFSRGQKFNIMSDQQYLILISKLLRYYADAGKYVIYLPHRYESRAVLDEIASYANVEVVEFDLPAEFALAKNGVLPSHVASFFSSALFHFNRLDLDIEITGFYIEFDNYCKPYKNEAEVLYSALASEIGQSNIVNIDLI